MSKKIYSPEELTERLKPQPDGRGECVGSAQRRPTIAKIAQLQTEDGLTEHLALFYADRPQDFESFVTKTRHRLKEIVHERTEEKRKRLEEFEEKKRIENLPRNAIPRAFFNQRAYPQHFAKVTTNYKLKDFIEVRDLTLDGTLDDVLGDYKDSFLTWISGVIQQKSEQEPNEPSHKNPKKLGEHILRYLHLI